MFIMIGPFFQEFGSQSIVNESFEVNRYASGYGTAVQKCIAGRRRKTLYQILDKTFIEMKIKDIIFCFAGSKKFPDHLFVGLRNRFSALESMDSPGGPQVKHQGSTKNPLGLKFIPNDTFKTINSTIRLITTDPNGDLWLTTSFDGIIYIRFTGPDISNFQIYRYNKSHGLPQNHYNFVYFLVIKS